MRAAWPTLNRLPVLRPALTASAVLLFCLLAVTIAAAPLPGDEPPTREQALRFLDRSRFDQAIEAFQSRVEAQPENGLAFFDLARAHHMAGHYEQAIEVGQRAAEFDDVRATSFYNVACSAALLGREDEAATALERAFSAGFLDFDLLAVDTDLELLRRAGRLPMPEQREYTMLRRSSVEIPYRVLLPPAYDPKRVYQAAVVFSPGGMGTASTDWTLDTIWADADARADWIIVCAAQPSNGWINHPSHHALNALMKKLAKQHRVADDRFHFIGLGEGGRPAATYSSMSRSYVQSLTLVDSLAFARWDDGDVRSFAREDLPLTVIVGGANVPLREEAARVKALVQGAEGAVDLVVLDGDGPALRKIGARQLLGRFSRGTR